MRIIIILFIVLLLAGCREGSSGVGSLFSSGGSSGDSGSSSGSGGGSGGSSGSGGGSPGGPAPIVNPEPSSIALFGVGLSALAAAMMKKKRRK
mgnify:CR=1 FL=1